MNTELILNPGPPALLMGLVTGVIFSLIHRILVEISMRNAIERHDKARTSFLAGALLRMAVLAIPLLTAMVIPRYVSVFTAFIGLMSVKLYLFFREVVSLRRR